MIACIDEPVKLNKNLRDRMTTYAYCFLNSVEIFDNVFEFLYLFVKMTYSFTITFLLKYSKSVSVMSLT